MVRTSLGAEEPSLASDGNVLGRHYWRIGLGGREGWFGRLVDGGWWERRVGWGESGLVDGRVVEFECVDLNLNGWMSGWTNGCVDIQMESLVDGWVGGRMDGWIDRSINESMDGSMDWRIGWLDLGREDGERGSKRKKWASCRDRWSFFKRRKIGCGRWMVGGGSTGDWRLVWTCWCAVFRF